MNIKYCLTILAMVLLTMAVMRDGQGRFVKGNSYWLGRKGKPANSGSFKKGNVAWNKGKRTYKICEQCGNRFCTKKGRTTRPHQRFCSSRCVGISQRGSNYGKKVHKMVEYKKWRSAVFKRDGNKCIQCGGSHRLEADHIKPKSKFPKLVFDVNNGRTLCHKCHKKTKTYGRHI